MDIQIEIGECLSLIVRNATFIQGRAGYISGRPENCYEAEPPEIDWKESDAFLMLNDVLFRAPEGFSELYYDLLLEKAIEIARAEYESY